MAADARRATHSGRGREREPSHRVGLPLRRNSDQLGLSDYLPIASLLHERTSAPKTGGAKVSTCRRQCLRRS